MKHLLPILTVICVLCAPLSGQVMNPNGVTRLHELIIPELELDKATLQEGISKIKAAWDAAHPDKSFPVVILEGQEGFSESSLRSTMRLKNVPALTAVTYLAASFSMTVRHGLDIVVLRPVLALDEGAWTTVLLQPSKKVVSFLDLPEGKDGDKEFNASLKKKLEGYGLEFDPGLGFEVAWFGTQLLVRNTPEEVSKVKGLFMLIDAGCLPTKSK